MPYYFDAPYSEVIQTDNYQLFSNKISNTILIQCFEYGWTKLIMKSDLSKFIKFDKLQELQNCDDNQLDSAIEKFFKYIAFI